MKKKLGKVFTILNTVKNICDSWEEVKKSTLTRVRHLFQFWKTLRDSRLQWRKIGN